MLEKLQKRLAQQKESIIELVKVPEEIREERLKICMSCDSLVKALNMCSKCGCIVNAKTWLPSSSCPIKKWDKHTS